jgi:hypothetical protein
VRLTIGLDPLLRFGYNVIMEMLLVVLPPGFDQGNGIFVCIALNGFGYEIVSRRILAVEFAHFSVVCFDAGILSAIYHWSGRGFVNHLL